ncbi:hypothetical protein MAHJHV60_47460 [Mycobacterium avium subsp. hominissuis]
MGEPVPPIGGTGSPIGALALEDAPRVVDEHGVQLLVDNPRRIFERQGPYG